METPHESRKHQSKQKTKQSKIECEICGTKLRTNQSLKTHTLQVSIHRMNSNAPLVISKQKVKTT